MSPIARPENHGPRTQLDLYLSGATMPWEWSAEVQRLVFAKINPEAYKCFLALKKYLDSSTLDAELHELIKVRASMINGCAYCVDIHGSAASAMGVSLRRITSLATWREAACFTELERAALEFTDAVTLIAEDGVPDDVWQRGLEYFSEKELCDVLTAIITINCFNRLAVTTRMVPADLAVPAHG